MKKVASSSVAVCLFLIIAYLWLDVDVSSLLVTLVVLGLATLLVLKSGGHEPTHLGTLQNGMEEWRKIREWEKSRR
ncbi:MAG: hypothetical protein RDU25_05690 [Patescibacteria group bacterium]|nr:hypothetical protein [Patescibacteria group bacterium]